MDRFVVRQNIEHFRQLLKSETDEVRRKILAQLLVEHEAKWADASPSQDKPQ